MPDRPHNCKPEATGLSTPLPDFETITSASNDLIKTLKSLERKKARSETGLFLAEGVRITAEGLTRGWTPAAVVVATGLAERPQIAALARDALAKGARVVLAPERLMQAITRKDNAQSVVAAFRQRQLTLESLNAPRAPALYVALHEVRDPGNLGTILRTADCAGADGVILIDTCCDPYSFEAVRASMGSLFDVPVATTVWTEFDTWRRAHRLSLAAATVDGALRHDTPGFTAPSVILFGNEQAGLPPELAAAADRRLRIPMRGGADSLNLAQAAAILIYEAWRQRGYKT